MTPEAVQIVREMLLECEETRDRCAKRVELRAAEDEPTELYAGARDLSAKKAEALSALLAVVEAVGKLPSPIHYSIAPGSQGFYCDWCGSNWRGPGPRSGNPHPPSGCLEPIRAALSSRASETRKG